MSVIRYKLRKLLPTLKENAALIKDRDILQRWRILKYIIESPKGILIACKAREVSTDFFYKWSKKILKTKSLMALKEESKIPLRSPKKTSTHIERKILALRKAEPYQGCDRISEDLKRVYKIKCPPSTVNAVLRRNNLISKKGSKKLTKKHHRRYRRPLPGYLQMDFKYVPFLIQNKQYYQLSCIDHHSSWRLIRCYEEKSAWNVMTFLKELIQIVPFPIFQLQTDNDAAFTDKYTSKLGKPTGRHPVDLWCAQHSVEHRLIPIGQKEINGKVENSHKQDDREFFSQINPDSLKAIQAATIAYEYRWNYVRRTKALLRQTPVETINNAFVFALAFLKVVKDRYNPETKPFLRLLGNGAIVCQIDIPKKSYTPKNKTKQISAVNRYLQYVKWDESNCVLPLSPIFLNYS